MVGGGFSAALHAEAYKKIYGYEVHLAAIYSEGAETKSFAHKYNIEKVCSSLEELLVMEGIDIVDICTPPCTHVELIKRALQAGKHVISEKPLTGYFGTGEERVGLTDKQVMLDSVIKEMEELQAFILTCNKQFFYAENFVYVPSVQKSKEILRATKNKILFMKAEESHSGSHAHHAALWKYTGGGSFMRQGCHPLSAILYLKQVEAKARGEKISVVSVMGDMGNTLRCVDEKERRYIAADPVDVEDCANVILTFSDGTKANVISGDMVVGGVKNIVEVYTTKGVHLCNITPNNQMRIYHVDEEGLDNIYVTEKVETKRGWQDVCIDEEITRGYVGELQNFIECIDKNMPPESGFELAYETAKVIYGAYLSAEKGKRIDF